MTLDGLIQAALDEDLGWGDVTTDAIVDARARCHARLTAKQGGVLSGISCFKRVFELAGTEPADWTAFEDGAAFSKGDTVASFKGLTRGVLRGERTALNFLQQLSGVATRTAEFVRAAGPVVCDTRKTTPLLRTLEKAAVRHGGGVNHRFGLSDGVLIKDNHIAAAGGIGAAVQRARASAHHLLKIEVEVTSLTELDEALAAGADVILLDNMSDDLIRQSVLRAKGKPVLLEASGNMTPERAAAAAAAGVHRVSVGALTHSAPAVDFSLAIERA